MVLRLYAYIHEHYYFRSNVFLRKNKLLVSNHWRNQMAYGPTYLSKTSSADLFLNGLLVMGFLFSVMIASSAQQTLINLEHELIAKSFTVHKSQVTDRIKACEALNESTNGYHAGNWRIEVSGKGVDVTCIQEGYRVPR